MASRRSVDFSDCLPRSAGFRKGDSTLPLNRAVHDEDVLPNNEPYKLYSKHFSLKDKSSPHSGQRPEPTPELHALPELPVPSLPLRRPATVRSPSSATPAYGWGTSTTSMRTRCFRRREPRRPEEVYQQDWAPNSALQLQKNKLRISRQHSSR